MVGAAVAAVAVVVAAAVVAAEAVVVAAAAAVVVVAVVVARPEVPAVGSTSTGTGRGRSGRRCSRTAGAPVRHSVPDAALSVARRAGMGHQFPAQYPAAERDGVLVAAAAPIRSLPLSLAGTLSGLAILTQRNLQLTPYILGETKRPGTDPRGSNQNGEFGFDVKYSLTPSLTLDGTYNTDFAQVEVDQQQINLDRFNLFFPEKRLFSRERRTFLGGMSGEAEVFFSRAIGIGQTTCRSPSSVVAA